MDSTARDFLLRLLDAAGPAGFERPAAQVWRAEAQARGLEVEHDLVGNSLARLPGRGPRVAVVGHIDELGLMITHVDADGFLWFQPIGGWDDQVLVGQRIRVLGAQGPVVGVIGKRPRHQLSPEDLEKVSKIKTLWIDIGARNADVYAMFGEPVADVAATIADIKRRAAGFGRAADDLGFSVSLRPILGPTEDAAWERAYDYLERIRARKRGAGLPPPGALMRRAGSGPTSEASRRLLAVAERGDIVDERLFMAIARETGAGGNSTAPVGTPEQVAQTIFNYVDAGATTILIRGFEPLRDAVEYGRDLVPLVRQEMAHRARRGVEAGVAAV